MDLFEASSQKAQDDRAPLAVRMRPRNIDEFVGQREVVGPGSLLRKMIEGKAAYSLILYGPPGTGKTTLAKLAAHSTQSHFEVVNAVTSGVADIRRVIAEAEERKKYYQTGTIVFIDEIHRFNKSQQDALLPAVEDGTITLIGATTENPFFEVNAPLISRARIVRLEPLDDDDLRQLIQRALTDDARGLGAHGLQISDDAFSHLIAVARGDARVALNTLELAALLAVEREERTISLEDVEKVSQTPYIRYDKDGDRHYDVISAFIKSMRGSDPDATLYWLARMLEAGEDPGFIARRIIIHASEDVGNADPMALLVATSAAQALDRVGLPEAQLALAQAAVYVATAPKSNAVITGIGKAREAVRKGRDEPVPVHLRDTHYSGARRLGHGQGYLYPHDDPTGHVDQNYLPEGLENLRFYHPVPRGYERTIQERLRRWRGD